MSHIFNSFFVVYFKTRGKKSEVNVGEKKVTVKIFVVKKRIKNYCDDK